MNVLPVQHRVRAVLAMALHLSVRLAVTIRYCIKMAERIDLILCLGATLGSSYNAMEVIQVSPKIRVLSSGTLSQILDLEKFCNLMPTITSVVNLGGRSL